MKELSINERESINGGLTLRQGQAWIGLAVLVASVVAAPAAVAFGGGVLVASAIVEAYSN